MLCGYDRSRAHLTAGISAGRTLMQATGWAAAALAPHLGRGAL